MRAIFIKNDFRLHHEPLSNYDPHVWGQHLQECLKRLLKIYDEFDRQMKQITEYEFNRRVLMESIYVIYNLGEPEANVRAVRLIRMPLFKQHKQWLLTLSLEISLDYSKKLYYRTLEKFHLLPHIVAAIAAVKLQKIQKYISKQNYTIKLFNLKFYSRDLLQTLCHAYHSKNTAVPLKWLQMIFMYYPSIELLIDDLKYFNCGKILDGTNILFDKSGFSKEQPVVSCCFFFIQFLYQLVLISFFFF